MSRTKPLHLVLLAAFGAVAAWLLETVLAASGRAVLLPPVTLAIALVLGFGSSGKMAAAYGIAVTGTMGVTSVLFFAVARRGDAIQPGAPSPFHGRHAAHVVATLQRLGVPAQEVDAALAALGLQREGYGNGSNYHDLLLVGTERRGINDGLTAEWHNELTSNQVRSGLGAIATAPGGGLIAVAVAGSASGEGSGWLGNANYEWRGDRLYGSTGVSYTTAGFDAATPISERTPRRRLRAALGWTLPGGSALSLSYLRQDRADLLRKP